MTTRTKGFRQRLQDGEHVIIAEGYAYELEQRGYLSLGTFVPEVVLEHPDKVKSLSEEFVHAGSDVVLAFTYYGNREKFRLAGREDDIEKQNLEALRIAREVADDTWTLMAGNLSNTTFYDKDDPKSHDVVREMFKEQVLWAVQGGADMIITETMGCLGEAKLAVQACKDYGNGLPILSNMVVYFSNNEPQETVEGIPMVKALQELEAMGVDVVGLNCARGPRTMLPLIKTLKDAVQIPVSCLPVCFRTDEQNLSWFAFTDPTGKKSWPDQLDPWYVSRHDISWFTKEAAALGVSVLGLCCGNNSHYTREMAEALGRKPPASKYAPDLVDFRPGFSGRAKNDLSSYAYDVKE